MAQKTGGTAPASVYDGPRTDIDFDSYVLLRLSARMLLHLLFDAAARGDRGGCERLTAKLQDAASRLRDREYCDIPNMPAKKAEISLLRAAQGGT